MATGLSSVILMCVVLCVFWVLPTRAICPSGNFRCQTSGECVYGHYRCDGEADCSDGSDEDNCVCSDAQFRCVESRRCVTKAWLCDGTSDCSDGSDEGACSHGCGGDWLFTCGDSGPCVPAAWRCDGDYDCQDRSDEAGCGDGAPTPSQPTPGCQMVTPEEGTLLLGSGVVQHRSVSLAKCKTRCLTEPSCRSMDYLPGWRLCTLSPRDFDVEEGGDEWGHSTSVYGSKQCRD